MRAEAVVRVVDDEPGTLVQLSLSRKVQVAALMPDPLVDLTGKFAFLDTSLYCF